MTVLFVVGSVKERCTGGATETPVKHSEDTRKVILPKPCVTILSGIIQSRRSSVSLTEVAEIEGAPMN